MNIDNLIVIRDNGTYPIQNNKISLFKQHSYNSESTGNLTEFASNLISFCEAMISKTDSLQKYEIRRRLYNLLIASYVDVTRQDIVNIPKPKDKSMWNKFMNTLQMNFDEPDSSQEVIVDRKMKIMIIPMIECDEEFKITQQNTILNLFNKDLNELNDKFLLLSSEILVKSIFKPSDGAKNVDAMYKSIKTTRANISLLDNHTIYAAIIKISALLSEPSSNKQLEIRSTELHNFLKNTAQDRDDRMFYGPNRGIYNRTREINTELNDIQTAYTTLKQKQNTHFGDYVKIQIDLMFPLFDLSNLKIFRICEHTPNLEIFEKNYDEELARFGINIYEKRDYSFIKAALNNLFNEYNKAPIGDLNNSKPTFLQMLRNRMTSMIKSVMSVKNTLNGPDIGNLLMKSYIVAKKSDNKSPEFDIIDKTAKSVEEMIENMSPMGARWILLPTKEFNNVALALYTLCHRATSVTGAIGQNIGLSAFKKTYGGREAGKKTYVVYNGRRYLVRKLDRKRAIKVNGALMALRDLKGWKKV